MIFSRSKLELVGDLENTESINSDYSKKLFSSLPGNRISLEDALISAGFENYESILRESTRLVNLAREIPEIDGLDLTDDEAGAISCYTLQVEEGNKSPYEVINEALAKSRDRKELMFTRKLIYLLLCGLRKLPRFRPSTGQVLYRGLRLKKENGHQYYAKGRIVTWRGFTSTTTDITATNDFIEKTQASILFNIGGVDLWGYDIKAFSPFQDEEEILLEPEAKVLVDGTVPLGKSHVINVNLQPFDHLVLEDIVSANGVVAIQSRLQEVPKDVKVGILLGGGFELSWNLETERELIFQIALKKAGSLDERPLLIPYEGNKNRIFIRRLEEGAKYEVKIRCRSGDMVGGWSEKVIVKIKPFDIAMAVKALKEFAADAIFCAEVLTEIGGLSKKGK